MEYTKVASDAFEKMQLNAGIVVDGFTPATGVIGNILGATKGGLSFDANPSYEDFGEDVDNVPANTRQLKRLLGYDPVLSGTFVTVTAALAAKLAGAAAAENAHVVPAAELTSAHFADVWVIGDYSAHNEGTGSGQSYAGFAAVHIKNALNTKGFSWQSAKNGKGEFPFEFHGHYDITDIDDAPWEIYVRAGA